MTAVDQQLPQLWLKHKKYDEVAESLPTISNGLYVTNIAFFNKPCIALIKQLTS